MAQIGACSQPSSRTDSQLRKTVHVFIGKKSVLAGRLQPGACGLRVDVTPHGSPLPYERHRSNATEAKTGAGSSIRSVNGCEAPA